MLFLQGTRDAMAEADLMASTVRALGPRATLHAVTGVDHSFKVPAKLGLTPTEVMAGMLDIVRDWLSGLPVAPRAGAP